MIFLLLISFCGKLVTHKGTGEVMAKYIKGNERIKAVGKQGVCDNIC
jgi:hypothetical protein